MNGGCDGCMYFARYECGKCKREYCRECSITHKCSDLTADQLTDLMLWEAGV